MRSGIILLMSVVSNFGVLGLRCPLIDVQLKPSADQPPPAE